MKPFSIDARIQSMRYAWQGIRTLLRDEHNARIHLAATIVVIALATGLGVSASQWLAILMVTGMVWLAEALNSALEYLCDRVCAETDPLIRKAKDVAAAGVFITAFIAFVCGLIIFLPLILDHPILDGIL